MHSADIAPLKFLGFAALLFATACAVAQPSEYTYKDLVKHPNTSRADKHLQSFLLGLGHAIRNDYVCDDKDSANLRNPATMVDELLAFAKTDWGKLYLEMEGTFGDARYPMTVGDVALKYYTQHSRCQRLAKAKEQLTR